VHLLLNLLVRRLKDLPKRHGHDLRSILDKQLHQIHPSMVDGPGDFWITERQYFRYLLEPAL
jgi:hypothetical protein